jgi:hypothetical protein
MTRLRSGACTPAELGAIRKAKAASPWSRGPNCKTKGARVKWTPFPKPTKEPKP